MTKYSRMSKGMAHWNPAVQQIVEREMVHMDDVKAKLRARIEDCRGLKKDWDSYGADPINEATINFALEMVDHLPPGDWFVVPSPDNSMNFECGNRTIEVFEYVEEPNTAEVKSENSL